MFNKGENLFSVIENIKELQVIEELVDFKEVTYVKIPKPNANFALSLTGETVLIRNLIDDSFNLEMGIHNYSTDKPNIPYAVINNKYYFQGKENNLLYNILDANLTANFKYKLHHSLIDSLKLKKTFVIAFGVDREDAKPYVHHILSPNFRHQKNSINFGINQALLLKTIKKITLKLPEENQFNFHTSGELKKLKPQIKIDYNYMYIVPEALSQTKANKTLFNIYMTNTDKSSFDYDYQFSFGILKSSFLKQSLTTSFVPFISKNVDQNQQYKHLMINNLEESLSLIGAVVINESTAYDYQIKKVYEDYGANSHMGQLIPFNYKGSFIQEIIMNLNGAFSNFKFRIFGKILHPLLDVDEGQVELIVKSSDEHLEPVWKINYENIKLIRARLKSNNPILTSLKAIKRMSVKIA